MNTSIDNPSSASPSIEQWGLFEITLEGTTLGNPFIDVEYGAYFICENRSLRVRGFYDGNGLYRVRFMPDTLGEWRYETYSNVAALDGTIGTFACVAPSAANHGPVHVQDTYAFAYADGTPFWQIGTTCYVWTHQGDVLEEQTLKTLSASPFNKIRMCLFPKNYRYNENEPTRYPFERSSDGHNAQWDFARFSPAFFQHFEQRIAELQALGIEADIILFHPYDNGRWGFDSMDEAADERYLRYCAARLSAYRNVWWSMANEYDLMKKSIDQWDRLFQILIEADPYQHLRSIHNWQELNAHDCHTFFDHTKAWVTHASIQHAYLDLVGNWRSQYKKPIVIDECCYEGDIPNGWGNLSAHELVHRFWEGTIRGGYVGHGETYLDPRDVLWWSKGGLLHGQSAQRIAFLRFILEQSGIRALNPVQIVSESGFAQAGQDNRFFLIYMGRCQPGRLELNLPLGVRFRADILDPWEMTVTPIEGTLEGSVNLPMPRKPYLAFRLQS